MNRKHALLLAILMGTAAVSTAQQVYRTVGPDGQVVYSDTPPASATSAAGGADSPAVPAPQHHAAKAAAAATAGPVDPQALQKALEGVIGLEDQVNQTRILCARTLPTAIDKYNAAANSWKERNAAVLAQKDRVLAHYDSDHRSGLLAQARQQNQQKLSKIALAPADARITWCDKAMEDMNHGDLDAINNAALAGPLTAN